MIAIPPTIDPEHEGYPVFTAHFIGGYFDGGERAVIMPHRHCQVGSTIYRLIAITTDRKDIYYADVSQLKPH